MCVSGVDSVILFCFLCYDQQFANLCDFIQATTANPTTQNESSYQKKL